MVAKDLLFLTQNYNNDIVSFLKNQDLDKIIVNSKDNKTIEKISDNSDVEYNQINKINVQKDNRKDILKDKTSIIKNNLIKLENEVK